MKKILSGLFIFIVSFISAQEKREGQLILFSGKYNNLFGRGDDFRTYNATLIINGDQSLFTMKQDGDDQTNNQLQGIDLHPDSLFTVFKDDESSSLIFEFTDLNQHAIYYADTLYPMEWKISQDEKMIGDIKCIKAICIFKGREYIAWYAPSIAISNGPWKLGGLPGLILEAYDRDEQWHLVYNSIKPIASSDFPIYDKIINKSVEGYKSYSTYVKKIFSRLQSAMSAQGTGDCLTCESKSVLKLNTWESID